MAPHERPKGSCWADLLEVVRWTTRGLFLPRPTHAEMVLPQPNPSERKTYFRSDRNACFHSEHRRQEREFEIVVPQDKGLVHYWRDNDAPGLPWHQGDILQSNNNSLGVGSLTVKGATLLQSIEGNLEVVMWLHTTSEGFVLGGPPGGSTVDYLVSSYRDPRTQKWSYPSQILVNGKLISGVTGTPAFIQSTAGKNGNFEIVVPQDGTGALLAGQRCARLTLAPGRHFAGQQQ